MRSLQKMKSFLCLAVLFAGAILSVLLSPLHATEPTDPRAHYAGMNLWFLNDWDGSNAFADIVMHARPWQKRNWNEGFATIDAEGWPLEDASTVFFGKDNQLGTYKLVVEGQVQNITLMWTTGSVSNIQYDAATNTTTADVTITNNNTGGLTLFNTRRTAGSALNTGFRNLRLYRPGHASDGSEVFDQRFLAMMEPFQVIRFMDWVDSNKNGEVSWSNRWRPGMTKRPTYSHQGQSGLTYSIPYEYMVQLCNRLGADMWLNIPTWADDDYVTKLAQLVKYGSDGTNPYTSPQASPVFPPLNPDLKVYLEYSNEVWNSAPGFRNFPWILGIADAIAADPEPHPIKLKLSDGTYTEIERYTLQARYTAYRSAQVSDIFRAVWGDAAMNTSIRVALMGQIGGNYFNPRQLPWLDAFYNRIRPGTDPFPNPTARPVSEFFFGAGGSAYYGANTWSTDPNVFFDPSNYPETGWSNKVAADAIRAKDFGLKRIAYEGGQGLDIFGRSGYPSASTAEKRALNADPRMRTMVEAYHDTWTANGGELLVYYVNTAPEDWEFTPSVNTLDTPKLNAARSIINDRQRVPVTLGQEIPGFLNARHQIDNVFAHVIGGTFSSTDSTGSPVIGGFDLGESIGFAVNTRYRGLYRLRLRAGTASTASLQIHVNGQPSGSVSLTGNNQSVMVDSSALDLIIPDEFNVIRVTVASGSTRLQGIDFEYIDPSVPRITSSNLPPAAQGRLYSGTIPAEGGTLPYSWTVTGGALPAGLSLHPSTGVVSGFPSELGNFSFTAQLTDSDSPAKTFVRSISLTVNPAPQITSATSLPAAKVGVPYSTTLTASGGQLPYSWSVSTGSLPPGLSLNSSTGVISGTPTTVGFSQFAITLADTTSPPATVPRTYLIDIAPPVPPASGAPAILHYAFDTGSGTAITDTAEAGNNHSTTLTGATWTADGKYGSALGSGGNAFPTGGITPANQSDLQFEPRTHEFTFSAWVRVPAGTSVGYRCLWQRGDSFRIWTVDSWSSIEFRAGGTAATLNLPDGVTLADGQWHLLTFVNYNDNGTWRFRGYHNAGATFVQGNSGTTEGGTSMRIGATLAGSNTWRGQIDDVRIYPRALSSAEIPLLHAGTLPANGVPVFSSWVAGFAGLPELHRGALGDPDGDGVVNLMEYALGTSPTVASQDALPQIDSLASGSVRRLRLVFTPANTFGLRYFVEASSDLTTWSEVTEITNQLTFGQPYIHIDPTNLNEAQRRFLRLRVIEQ